MADEEEFESLDKGAVFIFGKSRFCDGEPGRFWIQDDPILHVVCGDEHTALITSSGRVFTFGNNEWGQLGQGHTNALTRPVLVSALKDERAVVVACGRSHTLVGTDNGNVYGFGCNGEFQLALSSINYGSICKEPAIIPNVHKVKMLAGGVDHSIALTEKGSVLVWGSGSEGQLGLGERMESLTPTELKVDGSVICISAGYYHSAFITTDGKLWTFGEKEGGKLGLPDNRLKKTTRPQVVSGIPGKIVWVSCGGHHTVAITADGTAYSFGNGTNGQLGLGTATLSADQPKAVIGLEGVKVARVSCGESHSAFIAEGSRLYVCGDGRHGKLGIQEEDEEEDEEQPQFTPVLVSTFESMSVEQVSCGGCHTLVLAVDKSTAVQKANQAARARRRLKNLPPLELTTNYTDSNPLDKSLLPEIDTKVEDEVQVRKIKKLVKRRSMLKEAENDESIRHADSDVDDPDLPVRGSVTEEGDKPRSVRLASGELLSPMFSSEDNLDQSLQKGEKIPPQSKDNKKEEIGSPTSDPPSPPSGTCCHGTPHKDDKNSTPSRLSRIFNKKKSLSQQSSLDKMASLTSTPTRSNFANNEANNAESIKEDDQQQLKKNDESKVCKT